MTFDRRCTKVSEASLPARLLLPFVPALEVEGQYSRSRVKRLFGRWYLVSRRTP